MESVARDLNDRPDIPFIDSEDTETRLGKLYFSDKFFSRQLTNLRNFLFLLINKL